MIKLIHTGIFMMTIILTSYAQANLVVEDEATVVKTVTIGNNFFTDDEFTINSTSGNSQIDVSYTAGSKNADILTHSGGLELSSVTNDITFRTNNTTFARLLTNGDWGIGTATPDARLHVSQGGNSGINNPVLLLESVVSKKPLLQFSEGGPNIGSGMAWYMDGSPTQNRLHVLSNLGEELVTFSNLGRFGIGVIGDPRETLEVNGNILLSGSAKLSFMDDTTEEASLTTSFSDLIVQNFVTDGDIELISEQNDIRLEGVTDDVIVDAGDDIAFRISGENKMFMRPSGRLGINDTSPNAMIDIKQNIGDDGLKIQDNQNSDNWSYVIGANDLFLDFNDDNVGFFNDVNGFYTVTSDRRLKKSIEPIHDGVIEKLMKLQVSKYNYIDDESKEESIGFMAQDLLVDFPEVVTVRKNEKDEDYYSVSYELLNVLVVKAIQEQDEQKKKLIEQWNSLRTIDDELVEVNELISSLTMKLENIEK